MSCHGFTNATSEEELRAAASAVADLERPDGTVAPPVTRAQVVAWVAAWLADKRDWRHLDDRIRDLGWAFSVNAQPDVFSARDEHEFYKLMRAALPFFHRERPTERIQF